MQPPTAGPKVSAVSCYCTVCLRMVVQHRLLFFGDMSVGSEAAPAEKYKLDCTVDVAVGRFAISGVGQKLLPQAAYQMFPCCDYPIRIITRLGSPVSSGFKIQTGHCNLNFFIHI